MSRVSFAAALISALLFVVCFSSALAQEGEGITQGTLPVLPGPNAETSLEPLSSSPQELVVQGNTFYQEGAFVDAARAYETALAYGTENEVLHYNLGNALFRLGQLGPAILEYERALLLEPGDPDIRANLEFARAYATDIPPSTEEGPAIIILNWLRKPGINGSALVALVAYLIGAILLSLTLVGIRLRSGAIRALAVVAILLAIPPALVVVAQGSARELDKRAVVLAERVECRSGPGANNPVLFAVHEGTTVEVVDQQNGWSRVSLTDGLIGWLPQEAAERVLPPR